MLAEMSSNFAWGKTAKKTFFLGCKTFQLMHISGFLDIKIAILPQKILYFHTLSENHILCPKIHFLAKMTKLWIWIFVPKINDFMWFLYIDFLLDFEFSRQKWTKFNHFQFLIIFFDQNHDFLARNSNYSGNFSL